MPGKNPPPPLLFADTERSPDALYFGRVNVPDAFVAFELRGKKHAVVSALEFGRVKKTSDFDVVLPLEPYLQRARALWPERKVGPAEVIILVAKDHRQTRFTVPEDFPAGVYEKLFELGLDLVVADGPLFPAREIKTPAETAAIREGNRCSALGFAAAERILRASKPRGRKLIHRGQTLTSEMLKFAIEVACLEAGAVSANTIVAGGDQACDPHERGSGPLRPDELIIIDIFPRVTRTGFHGDMTRTFLRGRASDAQRALVAAVRAAQLAALRLIRPGANGRDVHRKVVEVFTARGFETKRTAQGSVGFFHGTGHGLGLAVHELPRVSGAVDYILRRNSVVTVEPGLYYPGLGGCRIEDVVQVTPKSATLLSRYPYTWEL
ncbi:M24 family metallopeptidase [Horticoccus sp. 23ND18S-11]|uniref:M24 family metallopeptidase n=1 Tax=Horticoccus sp. 23ND18S-11 TaxID=3391832 RepID=UPI0039C9E849